MTLLRRSLLATALVASLGVAHAADNTGVPKGPLPRTVVPTLVSLELKLDPKQANFTGTTRIEAQVSEATDSFWMHGRDLKISKAEAIVGKKRIALTATPADVSGVLKMQAAEKIPAGKAIIEIAYEAPFGELQGAYRVKPDGNDYIVTQMEPIGARNTFPSFDEPAFKQPWDITLIVPENDAAVANSAEAKTEKLPGGWKKVTFNRTEALPSYLVAFAVGPWDVPAGPDIGPNGTRTTPIKLRGVAAKGQGGRMTLFAGEHAGDREGAGGLFRHAVSVRQARQRRRARFLGRRDGERRPDRVSRQPDVPGREVLGRRSARRSGASARTNSRTSGSATW